MQNETARVLGVHRDVLRKAERDAEEIFVDLRASLGAAPVCNALREAVQSGRLTAEQRCAVLLAASSPPAARTVAAVQETLGVSHETARHWRGRGICSDISSGQAGFLLHARASPVPS